MSIVQDVRDRLLFIVSNPPPGLVQSDCFAIAAAAALLPVESAEPAGVAQNDPRFGVPAGAPPPAAKSKPPANACTDSKRHKYGEDRKCAKCGAADPRQPKQVTVPGAA